MALLVTAKILDTTAGCLGAQFAVSSWSRNKYCHTLIQN